MPDKFVSEIKEKVITFTERLSKNKTAQHTPASIDVH